jgi:hypothetical protein
LRHCVNLRRAPFRFVVAFVGRMWGGIGLDSIDALISLGSGSACSTAWAFESLVATGVRAWFEGFHVKGS